MELAVTQTDLSDPAEQAAVLQLLNEYSQLPHIAGQPLSRFAQDNVIDQLRQRSNLYVFLAAMEGNYVGLAICVESFSTFSAAPILNIHDIAVTASARGQGVGYRLLEAVESRARAMGCSHLSLEVNDANPARKLYARFGFNAEQDGKPADRFCKKSLR